MTVLFGGANYHLEHHLSLEIACYRLPKVCKLLKESGVFNQLKATTKPSLFLAYGKLASDYTVRENDSSFDPFDIAIETNSF